MALASDPCRVLSWARTPGNSSALLHSQVLLSAEQDPKEG